MTNITMKAIDTLHVSSVGPDNIAPGEEFRVSKGVADDLEARGLATVIGEDAEPAEQKAEPAPLNKMEQAPANKIIGSVAAKTKPKAN